jgi:shikimate 5-dehydrogenase
MRNDNPQSAIGHRPSAISGATRLAGVMGWPVSHSLSPPMHNAAFAALGLDWVYVPLPVAPERLADAVRGLAALGFAGSNATIPHKTGLVALMDELTPTAAAIASVNTIVVWEDGSLLGDSTDGYGFLADLRDHGVAVTTTAETHRAPPSLAACPENRRPPLWSRGFSRFLPPTTKPAKASNPPRLIFMRRGAAAGMGACPENDPAGLTQRRKGRQGPLSSSERLCVLASLRELFIRRPTGRLRTGAMAGMGDCPGRQARDGLRGDDPGQPANALSTPPTRACRRALVIGAGGAARAIVYALAERGAAVAVANRTRAAADELCALIARALPAADVTAHPFPDALPALAAESDLIVNTTSLGLHGDADGLPWDPAVSFRPDQVAYDLIYNVRTPFLALAQASGALAIDGLGMLVHQGAASFELWTGLPAPVDVMYAAIREHQT